MSDDLKIPFHSYKPNFGHNKIFLFFFIIIFFLFHFSKSGTLFFSYMVLQPMAALKVFAVYDKYSRPEGETRFLCDEKLFF